MPDTSSHNDIQLQQGREAIDVINGKLLELLSERARISLIIAERKAALGLPGFDPMRESAMLAKLAQQNPGPFPDETIQALFKTLFRATQNFMESNGRRDMLFSRRHRPGNTIIEVNGVRLGEGGLAWVAGPCSVENEAQVEAIAEHLEARGVKIMRGGAFKPRTSPYSFQGLGMEGVKLLAKVAERHHLAIVTEVMDASQVERVAEYAHILQIGARNMYNYPLLKAVGQCQRPVVLKRHFGATLEELLLSAEYVLSQGNGQVILCERGIRTFEPWARNTLDISAVPILHQETHLPVMVDISHAAGRRDILLPLARSVQAVGADAIMVEVHNQPAIAASDSQQQLDLAEFDSLQDACI